MDVTGRRAVEQALSEANRNKDEFLAMLAHELRNPLAPIRTALDLMGMQGSDPASGERARAVIERQFEHLVRLVDDLLDVSRITRDKLELRTRRVDLAQVLEAAVEAAQPLLHERGHRFSLLLPAEPVRLDADLTRLAQVFGNLLNNAAKFTEPGGSVEVIAERQGSDVLVRVRDTGVGFSPDERHRLFEMFAQSPPAGQRSSGGLGIGLALARRLVELHGGSIEAHSGGPGRGSEFAVRLPALAPGGPPVASTREEARRAPVRPLRILVADDNRDAADSLAQLLELAGHTVRMAYDGREAVDTARSFRPDAAVLDVGMPRLNGFEAAAEIRRLFGEDVALIALTGWGQESDRQATRDAGFDYHLTKPVHAHELLELLEGDRLPT